MKGRASALLALATLPLAVRGAYASGWSDWWRTRDQQAQRLLRAGDAAQAARLFDDPRWRAYAGLQSGQYAQAAAQLAPLHDGDSDYNRGNALAGAGQLQQALSAYDDALRVASSASNLERDARHNREVVARQLAQQQQQAQNQQNQQSANSAQSGAGQAGKQGKAGAKPATAGDQGPASAASQDRTATAGKPGQSSGQAGQQDPVSLNTQGAQAPPRRPETEQDISMDQWLRQIPDDPAGLLKRKFLVEHLLRQREASNAQ